MKNTTTTTTTTINLMILFSFMLILIIIIPSPSSSQSCKPFCGPLPLHFPFGSGPGCGHPSFNPHITCNPSQQSLAITTLSGTYPITSIDYTNHLLFIQDPSMSTCSTSCSSQGFSLISTAPFSFADFSFFALLSCSSSSSSIITLCDNSPICTLLSSCPSLSPSSPSSCCVYTPVTLGPAFQMNLKSLNCNSYTGVYSFNGDETNPAVWKYGIVLKYKFSVDDAYPSSCDSCERSGGVCGFTTIGSDSSSSSSSSSSYRFSCNCNGAMNTTTSCYFPSWSHAVIFSSPSSWTGLMCWILSLVWMFMISV